MILIILFHFSFLFLFTYSLLLLSPSLHLSVSLFLFLPPQYGDTYSADVESLWSALSTWTFNIRVVLNYLARLACLAGNMSAILKQVLLL